MDTPPAPLITAPPSRIGVETPAVAAVVPTIEERRVNECCAVCLDAISTNPDEVSITQCGHSFCVGCLATWLAKRTTCPLCRAEIGHRSSPLSYAGGTTSHRGYFWPDEHPVLQNSSVSVDLETFPPTVTWARTVHGLEPDPREDQGLSRIMALTQGEITQDDENLVDSPSNSHPNGRFANIIRDINDDLYVRAPDIVWFGSAVPMPPAPIISPEELLIISPEELLKDRQWLKDEDWPPVIHRFYTRVLPLVSIDIGACVLNIARIVAAACLTPDCPAYLPLPTVLVMLRSIATRLVENTMFSNILLLYTVIFEHVRILEVDPQLRSLILLRQDVEELIITFAEQV